MTLPVHPYFVPSAAKRSFDQTVLGGWIKRGLYRSRALAAIFTAVFVAVLLVTDQLVETWEDGNLFAVWVALWVIAFAIPALLSSRDE